jgi:zinc transport system substrate-binding protein
MVFALVWLVMVGLSGCSRHQEPPSARRKPIEGTISIYATSYPLKYFAERIGGTHVDVHLPVPDNEDPAYWTPNPETIVQYQQANLILLNGAGYAQWVKMASLPQAKVCNTSASFVKELIALDGAVTHSHGPEGEHTHGGTAYTTWLDPMLAIKHAAAIRDSLKQLQPKNAGVFQDKFEALKSDLEALDQEIRAMIGDAADRPVILSHPVYQYFVRRYGLNAKSLHWEPDEPPTETMLRELESLLAEHPSEWMIWEGEPLEPTKTRLAELGVGSVVFRPCGNVPPTADYLGEQRKNLARLAKVFSK